MFSPAKIPTLKTTGLLSLTLLGFSLHAAAADDTNTTESKSVSSVPPGFEFLNEVQTTVADFYYGDRYMASLPISYTPTTITINNPEQLVGRLPDIARPEIIQSSLSGEIPSNPAARCVGRRATNCGLLNPEIAGVIYDPGRFRVDVFIAKPYLITRAINRSRFLPDSKNGFGLVQGISFNTSGTLNSDDDQSTYNIQGNTVAGWKETHFISDWDQSKDNGFAIDTAFLARDAQGYQYGAGYLDSDNIQTSEFVSSARLLGVKLGTSQSSRIDSANVTSTPLTFFANTRGRIEVLRDNRLIYASQINAGSQEIDTSNFPAGSYQVTVRIYNGSTLAQEFTRLFVKSVRLPPSDEILWFFEAGEMTRRTTDSTLPERTGDWQARGGSSLRLAERASLTLMGTAIENEQLFEGGLYYQGDGWYTAGTGAWGSEGAKGFALEANAVIQSITANYYYRRFWHDKYQTPSNNNTVLMGPSFESRSLTLTAPFFGGNLSLSHNYNRDDADKTSRTDAVSWFRNLGTYYDYDFSLQLDYSEGDDDRQTLVSLTVRRTERDWDMGLTGEYRKEDNNGQKETYRGYTLDGRWRNNTLESGYLEAGMNYEDFGQDRRLSGDLNYDTRLFAAELTAERTWPESGSNSTSYTGRLETSLAINNNGISIGGNAIADSVLLVKIDGSPDTLFDVQVNGNTVGLAQGGSSTVIPVTPFATYQVRIKPRGDAFYEYDQTEKSITLYPGNVASLRFRSQEVMVILGRLIDSNGKVLASATIGKGNLRTRSNDYGIFQYQMAATNSTLSVTTEAGASCNASLPTTYSKRGGVGMVGALVCN